MKFIKLILPALWLFFCSSESLFAWDSTAAKYMPLQVGNVWVYSASYSSFFGSGTSFERYRITGNQLVNGRTYFVLNHTHVQVNGLYGCSSRLFSGDYALRIDSASMNLYKNSGCGSSLEGMVDSLASKYGDSSLTCFNMIGSKTAFNDTSDYYIFNTYFDAMKFATVNINGGNDQIYLKGIGLAKYYSSINNENCNHILKGCIINGVVFGDTSIIVGINQIGTEIPEEIELSQNYPNPFNPATQIGFKIAESGFVRLTVFDMIGKEVEILISKEMHPGTYESDWGASAYPSGVYYYRLEIGDFSETKKMVLIK